MSASELQMSHVYSTYFAPRGRKRIFTLGIQLAQLYLSPFDHLIGIIGEAGSGKSMLIKGMFPGLELTNDDDGVNVRPLPILDQDQETGFFSPHTYHLDIRFEMAFQQMSVLADAISQAISRGKRVIVEHFDLIYPFLKHNADLLIGVGEEIIIARPTLFGPEPQEVYNIAYKSLPYRLMAHSAEDLCERLIPEKYMETCSHGDVHHGFTMIFEGEKPDFDILKLEADVREMISRNLPIEYVDDSHVAIGGEKHLCTGPRTHVSSTGKIENFCLLHDFVFDPSKNSWILVGSVGEGAADRLEKLRTLATQFERFI